LRLLELSRTRRLLLAGVVFLAACPAPEAEPTRVDAATAREEIMETNRRAAELERAGDVEGILGLWTENAVYLTPEGVLRGRPAIQAAARDFFREHAVEALEIDPIEIQVFGDTAVELGTFSETVRGPEGEIVELDGGYMAVRVRRADGTWAFHRFISNVRSAPGGGRATEGGPASEDDPATGGDPAGR
jgi:uncharacterized protein (TIGR02246 family)